MKKLLRGLIDKAGLTIFRNDALPVGTDYRKTLRRLFGAGGLPVVIDAGANEGQFCLACHDILRGSKIYSFEPVKATFDLLQQKTAGIPNIECLQLGLGDAPGSFEMYLRDLSTINSISPKVNVRRSDDQPTQTVQVVTIDDFCKERGIETIDLLKVDVEGFDLEVLKGARRMLENRKVRFIFIEVTFDAADAQHCTYQDIFDFIAPFGFKVHGFYNQNIFWGSPMMNYCDALFHLQPQE